MRRCLLALLFCLVLCVPIGAVHAQGEDTNQQNDAQQTDEDFDATLSTVIRGLDLDSMEQSLYQSDLAKEILGHAESGRTDHRNGKGLK